MGIGALPGAFKYLSYSLAGSDHLVVDVWKSTFAPARDIFRVDFLPTAEAVGIPGLRMS